MKEYTECLKCGAQLKWRDIVFSDKAHTKQHPWCRECRNTASRDSRQKKLEHYRAKNSTWNSKNPAVFRAAVARYRAKARKAKGLTGPVRLNRRWTRGEEAYLLENYRYMSRAEIGERLGRTPMAVSHRVRQLGITKEKNWYLDGLAESA